MMIKFDSVAALARSDYTSNIIYWQSLGTRIALMINIERSLAKVRQWMLLNA